jgi:hypothetical protein
MPPGFGEPDPRRLAALLVWSLYARRKIANVLIKNKTPRITRISRICSVHVQSVEIREIRGVFYVEVFL